MSEPLATVLPLATSVAMMKFIMFYLEFKSLENDGQGGG